MRESKILKLLSYIVIPILIFCIVISVIYGLNKNTYANKELANVAYFESNTFLNDYMTLISKATENLIYKNENYKYVKDGEYTIYYEKSYGDGNYEYYANSYTDIKSFYYIIIYKQKVFTNVELTTKTNTLALLKEYVSKTDSNVKYANIINGAVDSNSEIISSKAIQYFDNFKNTYYTKDLEKDVEEMKSESDTEFQENSGDAVETEVTEKEKNFVYITTSIQDFQIYSKYKQELVDTGSNNSINIFYKNFLTTIEKYETYINYVIPVCAVVLVAIFLYLIIAVGHSKGKKEIDINDFDKMPLEIIIILLAIFLQIWFYVFTDLFSFTRDVSFKFMWSCIITGYLILYIVCISAFTTIVKRFKAKIFYKTLFLSKIFKVIYHVNRRIERVIYSNFSANSKIILISLAYISIIFTSIYYLNLAGIIISFCITIFIVYKILEKVMCFKKIEKYLKEMYEGNAVSGLDKNEYTKDFEKIILYLNDITNGLEKLIKERVKNEKLKTELITNVSHDIKTPLTSIISYIDLIKKENPENEKIQEYIDILDSKSQRLKKLTEDLIEASKVSSGNVKLEMKKIVLNELIKQSIGEFEDKFISKKLEIIANYPKEKIYIMADNRYLYRVIENLFSNISKYSLENSRVYIDVMEIDKQAVITIKNISKNALNVSEEELMQRFVRGDKSRTTEGNGLGLSISRSLTELQKGKFDIEVDGDLFKVKLIFDIV